MNVTKAPPVSLTGFSLALGERTLVRDLDFAPAHGSSSVVIGQTGVGKSVFLKAIAGVLPSRTFRLGGSMQVHGIDAYVNGRKTGVPSFLVKTGDEVKIKEKSKTLDSIVHSLELREQRGLVNWIEVDTDAKSAIVKALPERKDMPMAVEETLIVEFYSK